MQLMWFCVQILYPISLLNSFINYGSFLKSVCLLSFTSEHPLFFPLQFIVLNYGTLLSLCGKVRNIIFFQILEIVLPSTIQYIVSC